jgi:hypothetical protein
MTTDTRTTREKLDAGEKVSFPIHPDVRFAMLAARASGMLGERAYKRVFDLEPTDIGMLIAFCEDLKSCKERETPEQKKARGA